MIAMEMPKSCNVCDENNYLWNADPNLRGPYACDEGSIYPRVATENQKLNQERLDKCRVLQAQALGSKSYDDINKFKKEALPSLPLRCTAATRQDITQYQIQYCDSRIASAKTVSDIDALLRGDSNRIFCIEHFCGKSFDPSWKNQDFKTFSDPQGCMDWSCGSLNDTYPSNDDKERMLLCRRAYLDGFTSYLGNQCGKNFLNCYYKAIDNTATSPEDKKRAVGLCSSNLFMCENGQNMVNSITASIFANEIEDMIKQKGRTIPSQEIPKPKPTEVHVRDILVQPREKYWEMGFDKFISLPESERATEFKRLLKIPDFHAWLFNKKPEMYLALLGYDYDIAYIISPTRLNSAAQQLKDKGGVPKFTSAVAGKLFFTTESRTNQRKFVQNKHRLVSKSKVKPC